MACHRLFELSGCWRTLDFQLQWISEKYCRNTSSLHSWVCIINDLSELSLDGDEVALRVAGNLLFVTRGRGRESINSFRKGIDYSPKHMFTLVMSSLQSQMLHKDFGEKENFWLDFNCLPIYVFGMLASALPFEVSPEP